MRSADVYVSNAKAGTLHELERGFRFVYEPAYLERKSSTPVSLTLPMRVAPYDSNVLHPFFDGLIPEGWLMDIAVRTWKADPRDRLGLLLTYCNDCIGNVSVRAT